MIIYIILLILFVMYALYLYNDLVVLRMRVREALSQIEVQLKRRADLIPNLVSTVKGYAKHEKGILEEVTKARSTLLSAGNLSDKAAADNQLAKTLKTLFAVAENYPQLKASENFLELQKELEDTEDKVSYSRQFYNKSVMDYNSKLQLFPNSIIANNFNFKSEEFFKTKDEDKKKPDVTF